MFGIFLFRAFFEMKSEFNLVILEENYYAADYLTTILKQASKESTILQFYLKQ